MGHFDDINWENFDSENASRPCATINHHTIADNVIWKMPEIDTLHSCIHFTDNYTCDMHMEETMNRVGMCPYNKRFGD